MRLGDAALRDLVERLCAADVRALGLSRVHVDASGHQDARDGGVDVAVAGGAPPTDGYLRRTPAIFQAKATKMAGPAITREMRPKGTVRPAIADLAARSGLYVIACGGELVTEAARRDRVSKMQAAVSELPDADRLDLDFYDAKKLADWASGHRGVALWLLEAAGRPARGWSALSTWSTSDEGLEATYLVDGAARLSLEESDAMGVVQGLEAMRAKLATPRSVLRLLGQSGMGKTRLAQALFDNRVGSDALPADLALYGDAGEPGLAVTPLDVARRLLEEGHNAILIVDNCAADLHAQLATFARRPEARFSLLTIDFDVTPDRPEHTIVCRLDRNGDELIAHLLARRSPRLNLGDIDRVVAFSEGNTRVALAVAGTARTSNTLARLSNQALVDRLFLKDRRGTDPELQHVAAVASLVYAFEAEGEIAGERAELETLACLADVSPARFLARLGDLLERGLAQQRGRQRAILPQALAATLAASALRRLDLETVMIAFITGPQRLKASFLRRLMVLHDSPEAVELARRLLASGAFVPASAEDNLTMESLSRLAPLQPRAVLDLLAQHVERHGEAATIIYTNQAARRLTATLAQLAYEPALFDDAARLMARLVLAQDETRMIEKLRDRFVLLFQPIRSGTHASADQRFALLDELLDSAEPATRRLGFDALRKALLTRCTIGGSTEAF
jgi:hypothetical protein